ncbi:hypothetical protein AALI21_02675 [Corynebacteriaceae bacterium 6-324]
MSQNNSEPIISHDDGRAEEVNFAVKTDFQGKARLYTDDTGQSTDFYDLTDLDREEWLIVGFNLNAAGCRLPQGTDSVYVYAINRIDQEQAGRGLLEPDETGDIPVVSFLCHDLSIQDIFENVVQAQISFKLKSIVDKNLHQIGLADRPNQED